MFRGAFILQTKLTPPRPRRETLNRARIDSILQQSFEYRLTVLQASAGYGKSTALAHFAAHVGHLSWYSVSEGDSDPLRFIAYLVAAFQNHLPGLAEHPFSLGLEDGSAIMVIDQLINALNNLIDCPALMVIDDYHLAESSEVNDLLDYFLRFLPRDLHVIVSTRISPAFEHMADWRARGDVLEIKDADLAFTPGETATLFCQQFQIPISSGDLKLLFERTEGWPIALQLVRQGLRGKDSQDMTAILGLGSPSLETLFTFLARNVLQLQQLELRDFLLRTSVLRELDTAVCQAVTERESRSFLTQLCDRELLIVELGNEHYCYHHLFQEFLRQHALRQNPALIRQCHLRAAEYYQRTENFDEAIYHYFSAGQTDRAIDIIERIGENILSLGRLDTLAGWLETVPLALVKTHPMLMFLLGETTRLRSRYEDALIWYSAAQQSWHSTADRLGESRALCGQALVYLDTVRPAQAEALLQEAITLSNDFEDRAFQARLFELLAENKLNMGKPLEASELRLKASYLRNQDPVEDALSVRIKIRTGQLQEARSILEAWANAERGQIHIQRAHRETLLLLALVCAIQGDAEKAVQASFQAKALAEELHSPYVRVASLLRLGHAYQVSGELRQALKCYETAIVLGDEIALRRTRAEAQLGLARVHGLLNDLEASRRAAEEGIEVARSAGDTWFVTLLHLVFSINLVESRREVEGIDGLEKAFLAFQSCGDQLGMATAQMWLALAYWRIKSLTQAIACLNESLALAQGGRYDFLFTRRTLFGMPDPRVIVPLLIDPHLRGACKSYAKSLLTVLGLESITVHPGYQLRIQTLGAFRIWQGAVEILPKWRRLKARELFQFLITHRGRMMQREEIIDVLWRDNPPVSAVRNFKVALNALNKILEPERDGTQEPAFIERNEAAYGLRHTADIWIDAEEFESLMVQAEQASEDRSLELFRRGLFLYQGDYLEIDALYADWAHAERQRLHSLFLRSADHFAELLIEHDLMDDALTWCENILASDQGWEHAYQLLMRIHSLHGDIHLVDQVFERCRQSLHQHLDAEPSPATISAWKQARTCQYNRGFTRW